VVLTVLNSFFLRQSRFVSTRVTISTLEVSNVTFYVNRRFTDLAYLLSYRPNVVFSVASVSAADHCIHSLQ